MILNKLNTSDWSLTIAIFVSILLGTLMLWSIAPTVFPQYFLYIALAIVMFFVFTKIDFSLLASTSTFLYIGSILFLILPIFFGVASRGAVRWIFLGKSSLQPTEIVRPFLILFFADYFTKTEVTTKRLLISLPLMALPLTLIFLQPALGMTILTAVGFFGVLIVSRINPKIFIGGILAILLSLPVVWFLMQPYQKTRVLALLEPSSDPTGASYNSIQSMIAVGSGQLTGRGLGKGIQTQLSFLPEKHNDFIFASTGEELGFLGAFLVLFLAFFIFYRLVKISEHSESPTANAYVVGILLSLFLQVMVHAGMNMGIFPITGLPFPLVSYGGSSLLSSMVMLAIALQAKRASGTIHQYEIRSLTGSWKSI